MSARGNVTRGPWEKQVPVGDFEPFTPAGTWHSPAPRYDWMIDGMMLRGTVALLSGDGGLGKSLLLQQLCTCAAIGEPWLGLETQRCASLAVFCEDGKDELHRRQERINAHYRCEMKDLTDFNMVSRQGKESVIMRFKQWGDEGFQTDLFEQIAMKADQCRAQIIILDTLADVFSGNEIDRNQPRTFIRHLSRLAIRVQGIVIVTQHPSVDGLANGSGRSGSTGWRNSVRSMFYLTKPRTKASEDEKPTNERWLKTTKNNAGRFGQKIRLDWQDGVFVRKQEEVQESWWTGDE